MFDTKSVLGDINAEIYVIMIHSTICPIINIQYLGVFQQ